MTKVWAPAVRHGDSLKGHEHCGAVVRVYRKSFLRVVTQTADGKTVTFRRWQRATLANR